MTSKVCLVIPVYNDWASLEELLRNINVALRPRPESFCVLIVDDGSTEAPLPPPELPRGTLFSGKLLRLQCNLGHQRAIAIGLSWLQQNDAPDAAVVLDGDGEDKPEDVVRLLEKLAESRTPRAVFAERTRRSEGPLFATFYRLYQFGHLLLTGIPVRIGNFSVLPRQYLNSLVVSSYLWNHYAATVVRLRLPMATIPTHRGLRYHGRSKMNFVSLVRHGINALAVHSEVIATRLLIATGAFLVLALAFLAACLALRLFTPVAIPAWTTWMAAIVVVLVLQVLSITFSLAIHSFSNMNSMASLPVRDYKCFVGSCQDLPIRND